MCDVLYCRNESTITVLGVSLCDEHYWEHCDGLDLKTRKGLLTFSEGATVVK
jgi:hypothetical protein